MSGFLQNVTHLCFLLSYAVALGIELVRLRWRGPGLRIAGLSLGAAGLFAHTAFLAFHLPNLATPYGTLLVVAWVLGVFYLYGSLHHGPKAWAVFVLPVILGLVAIALLQGADAAASASVEFPPWLIGDRFWGAVHGVLLLCAAVGVSVGFLASVMYLIQADRLKKKAMPLGGLKLLSLERLEAMNRRAVNASFPLLTGGLLLGALLLRQYHDLAENWASVKVLGTVGLWGAFAVLLYLRYAAHVPGRRLALLTIAAFALMVVVLAAAHPFAAGGTP